LTLVGQCGFALGRRARTTNERGGPAAKCYATVVVLASARAIDSAEEAKMGTNLGILTTAELEFTVSVLLSALARLSTGRIVQ
jgi:hypothetical protein